MGMVRNLNSTIGACLLAALIPGCKSSSTTECFDPGNKDPGCRIFGTATATGADALPNPIVAPSPPPAAPGAPTPSTTSPSPPATPTVGAKDTTLPVVGSGIVFSGLTATSVTLSWGAASDDGTPAADLQYKVLKAPSLDIINNPNLVTVVQDWTKNLTTATAMALTTGVPEYFAVIVRDVAGNVALYSPKSATPVDAVAPVVGSPLVFSAVTTTEMTLTWGAASDDVTSPAQLAYKVACVDGSGSPGVLLDWSANTTTITARGLSPQTTYTCTVSVRDGAANQATYPSGQQATATPAHPTITVTAPNGGEFYYEGTARPISWTSTDLADTAPLKIEYTTNGGTSWTTIIDPTANSGSYPWTPNIGFVRTVKVRVSLVSDPTVFGQSQAVFTINGFE